MSGLETSIGSASGEQVDARWGFLKNIINIDRFFSSGPEDSSAKRASSKKFTKKSADTAEKEEAETPSKPEAKEKDEKKSEDKASKSESKEKTSSKSAQKEEQSQKKSADSADAAPVVDDDGDEVCKTTGQMNKVRCFKKKKDTK